MPFSIQGGRQDPTLEYDVTDAATGAPMRVTIASGVVALVFQATGMFQIKSNIGGDPREQMGFHVPAMPAVPHGPEPLIVAEMFLQQVGVYDGSLKATKVYGVGDVQAQLQPDAHGQRWVYLSFSCIGAEPMAVRYRVTMYRSRG